MKLNKCPFSTDNFFFNAMTYTQIFSKTDFRSNIIITVFWMEMKKTLTLLVVVITILSILENGEESFDALEI